jgi:hypothetical protein
MQFQQRRYGLAFYRGFRVELLATYYGFVITPHAIRGGALADTSPATACITSEVPPLLNTELLSEPKVTYGAVVVACAVPSASTVSTKLGMSPAIKPVGLWSAPAALKWGPADLKSGASHFAN